METDKKGMVCIDGKQVVVDREKYNAYYQKYREKNSRKLRKYYRKYNKAWRKENGLHNEQNSRLRYPEKERARRQLREAVNLGKITRNPCEVCGKQKAHGHHDDYSKPLEVRWLCALHHSEVHKKLKATEARKNKDV